MKVIAVLAALVLTSSPVFSQPSPAPAPPPGNSPPPSAPPPGNSPPPSAPPPGNSPPPPVPPTVPPPAPPPGKSPPPPPTVPPPPAPPPAPTSPPPPARVPATAPNTSTAATTTTSTSSGSPSDADVLTFAYNLACLLGQFYNCAAFGTPLASSITGNGPAPSSCKKANLNSTVGTYAAEYAREESAHVTYLYNALKTAGGSPVCPQVNIDSAFEAAAEAAFNQPGTALNPTFDPYANDVFFLHAVFILEDLAASAYLGAQGLLQNPSFRQVAGQIGNSESYESAEVRTLLYQILTTTPAYGKTVQQITSAIVAVLNKLSGSPQLKYELTNSQGSSIANVDSNGFVPVATPSQVLKIVTLGAAAGSGGGFFPTNLVGNIKN